MGAQLPGGQTCQREGTSEVNTGMAGHGDNGERDGVADGKGRTSASCKRVARGTGCLSPERAGSG